MVSRTESSPVIEPDPAGPPGDPPSRASTTGLDGTNEETDGIGHSNGDTPLVTVVIITKDEVANIGRCLKSCREALRAASLSGELVVMDSNSTDGTVEVASRLADRVIGLPIANAPFAGRFVGGLLATGKHVQFIDGDMELDREWLRVGTAFLESNPTVGATAGVNREAFSNVNLTRIVNKIEAIDRGDAISTSDARILSGGAILIRREALQAAGQFHPFLVGLEQLDISWRIRDAEFELRRLQAPMATHHGYSKALPFFHELRKRWNTYFLGNGQCLRFYVRRHRNLVRPLVAQQFMLPIGLVVCELLALAAFAVFVGAVAHVATGIALLAVSSAFAASVLGLAQLRPLPKSVVYVNANVLGLLVGFASRPRMAEDYPLSKVVQIAPPSSLRPFLAGVATRQPRP